MNAADAYPLHIYGGDPDAPVLHLALANGFPPATYVPFVEPLTAQYRVITVLPRALWYGTEPPQRRVNWRDGLARDLLDGLRAHNLREVIGVGHSFGGVATLLAAAEDRSVFRAVALLDPTLFPPPMMWIARLMRLFGRESIGGLAERTEKRRDHFEDTEAAYQYFKGKRLFADWPDATVRRYAESMIPAADGGVALRWPRDWEAYGYRTLYTGTWRHVNRLRPLPVLTIRGTESNTFFPTAASKLRRMLPDMTYHELEGHGHLFPHSAPDETRALLSAWLHTETPLR